MADYSIMTEAGQAEQQFRRMSAMIRVALPGKITAFNPASQRARAVPAVKLKQVLGEQVKYMDMPEITDIPIVIPQSFGGGVALTVPIQAGDPCLLIFADRALDNFLQTGNSENPGASQNEDTTTPRAHHLSDAICIPGFVAAPQALPDWNQDNIELRDKERKTYISLGPDGITLTDGQAKINLKGGKITTDAPGGIEETASTAVRQTSGINALQGSNINVGAGLNEFEGSLKSRSGTFIDANDRDSTAHRHSGVQSGPSESGPTSR